jgi:hypothetical protein
MTTADEAGKCPECGSANRGTRYSLTPQIMDGDPLARFCRNAWHVAPKVQRDDEFTALEFQVIFAFCWGGPPSWRLNNEEMAQQLGITEESVQRTMVGISNKVGMGLLGLSEFVRTALNDELRRRRLSPGTAGLRWRVEYDASR